jgi:hypothetical protein
MERHFVITDLLSKQIVNLLSKANQQMLKESEVRHYALQFLRSPKRWFRFKLKLIQDGVIRSVLAKVHNSEELIPCLQLVKPFEQKGKIIILRLCIILILLLSVCHNKN